MSDGLHAVPAANGAGRDGAVSAEERTRILTTLVAEKVDQGYLLESQTDTEAVITAEGRTRWFGLRGRLPGSRRRISVDEHGRPSTRRI